MHVGDGEESSNGTRHRPDTDSCLISQNRAYTAARPAVSLPLHFILTFLMLYVSMYDNQ